MSERKVCSLKNAVEETKSMLEQSDKIRRQIEQEISETSDEQSKFVFQNTSLDQEKRKLEAELSELQVVLKGFLSNFNNFSKLKVELEEVKDDLKERDAKAKDCMIDASKLAEELHNEQEQTTLHENDCKILESKLRELQVNGEHSEIYSHLLRPIELSLI